MSGGRRWELHVCRGCDSYAGKYDLGPRFGNIVGHEGMTKGCTEPAEVIEVVPASRVEALEQRLEKIAAYGDRDEDWLKRNAYIVLAECIMEARHGPALAPPEGEK